MERGLLSFITEHMSEHFRVRGEDLLSCRVTTDTSRKAWRGKNTVMTKIYLFLSLSAFFIFNFLSSCLFLFLINHLLPGAAG